MLLWVEGESLRCVKRLREGGSEGATHTRKTTAIGVKRASQ